MDNYDIRDELLSEVGSRPILRARHLVYILIAAGAALYIYHLFYGDSSLLMLMELKDQQAALETRIETLKAENAELRRDLYELRLIYGEAGSAGASSGSGAAGSESAVGGR